MPWYTVNTGNNKSENDDIKDEGSITDALMGFKETTTLHGISHITNSKGLLKRFSWSLFSLGCIIGLFYNLYAITSTYLEYKVDTTTELINSRQLVFPAVSICNYNPVKQSMLNLSPRLQALLVKWKYTQNKSRHASIRKRRGVIFTLNIECTGKLADGFEEYEYCLFFTPKTSWLNANQECLNGGGRLAVINSKRRTDFIFAITMSTPFWIGLHQSDNGLWVWSDGSFLEWTNWNAGSNPNILSLGYVYMDNTSRNWKIYNKSLDDHEPEISYPFMCEYYSCTDEYRDGTTVYKYCYYDKKKTYKSASGDCIRLGGTLAVMNNQNKYDYVVERLPMYYSTWIGLKNISGDWIWQDGSALNWSKWETGLDTSTGSYVYITPPMSKSELFEWNIADNSKIKKHYMCQYVINVMDTTSGTMNTDQNMYFTSDNTVYITLNDVNSTENYTLVVDTTTPSLTVNNTPSAKLTKYATVGTAGTSNSPTISDTAAITDTPTVDSLAAIASESPAVSDLNYIIHATNGNSQVGRDTPNITGATTVNNATGFDRDMITDAATVTTATGIDGDMLTDASSVNTATGIDGDMMTDPTAVNTATGSAGGIITDASTADHPAVMYTLKIMSTESYRNLTESTMPKIPPTDYTKNIINTISYTKTRLETKMGTTIPVVQNNDQPHGKPESSPPQLTTQDVIYPARKTFRNEFMLQSSVIKILAEEPLDVKTNMGYTRPEFMIGCKYQGKHCSGNKFGHFYDSVHGNCYVFNGGWNTTDESVFYTADIGNQNGVTFTLNLIQPEYIETIGDAAGALVVVHKRDVMPFPGDQGIMASPGSLLSLGTRQTSVVRMGGSYSDCLAVDSYDNENTNVFAEHFPVKYTVNACEITCYQQHLIRRCKCADPQYPITGRALGNKPVAICDVRNISQDNCVYGITEKYNTNNLNCRCPKPCIETAFTHSISYASWPTEKQLVTLSKHYANEIAYLKSFPRFNHMSNEQIIRSNFLQVKVFMEDLNYYSVVDKSKYPFVTYISDLGSMAGLWLGCCIITLVEFFELAADILYITSTKIKKYIFTINKNRNRFGVSSLKNGFMSGNCQSSTLNCKINEAKKTHRTSRGKNNSQNRCHYSRRVSVTHIDFVLKNNKNFYKDADVDADNRSTDFRPPRENNIGNNEEQNKQHRRLSRRSCVRMLEVKPGKKDAEEPFQNDGHKTLSYHSISHNEILDELIFV